MAPSLTGQFAGEDASIEQPALAVLAELGWQTANLIDEKPGPGNPTGRSTFRQTYLPARLRAALMKLNPTLPPEALKLAEDELTRDRSVMLPVGGQPRRARVAARRGGGGSAPHRWQRVRHVAGGGYRLARLGGQ